MCEMHTFFLKSENLVALKSKLKASCSKLSHTRECDSRDTISIFVVLGLIIHLPVVFPNAIFRKYK